MDIHGINCAHWGGNPNNEVDELSPTEGDTFEAGRKRAGLQLHNVARGQLQRNGMEAGKLKIEVNTYIIEIISIKFLENLF